MEVLDLFAGIGGLSSGFHSEGFAVTGVDNEPVSQAVFQLNDIGKHILTDLLNYSISKATSILIGGPPCRPWSVMNVQRRRDKHGQYRLLGRFFDHLTSLKPTLFLMENVPAIKKDPTYIELMRTSSEYSIESRVLAYADFGAATRRRRLITFGIQKNIGVARDFFELLDQERLPSATVGDRIRWLRDTPAGGFPDHEWSQLNTIDRYAERYESGRFGWTKLKYDQAAPSFGSVAKTYILHPDAGQGSFPQRVISIREVLLIMGFDRTFRFPEGKSRTIRYQMAADAVSPVFSAACARAVKGLF